MSQLPKPNPGLLSQLPDTEARARAALVEVESREAEAARNIRAIGKDPHAIPASVMELDTSFLYSSGMRPERRQVLLRQAILYLFNVPIEEKDKQNDLIVRMGSRCKLMIDWMIRAWESHLRPKTWMDSLSPEQQEKWAVSKRIYDNKIQIENQRLAAARAAYYKVVDDVQTKQAIAREELRSLLREFGLTEAPLLHVPTDEDGDEKLFAELREMGLNFRPPQSQY